jgi:type IX secretion system PorP/SprF family membrane protein
MRPNKTHMKKRYCILLAAIVCQATSYKAQDIHFSQVYESPLYLSPANTGFFNGYTRVIANYRSQWAAMNNAFKTIGFSLDGGLFKSKKRPAFMGLGLTVFNDRAGAANMRSTTAQVNLSGLVKLGKKSAMSAAIAGGATSLNADYGNLTYESQFNGNTIDPAMNSLENPYRQFTTVDVAAGLAYEFTSFRKDNDHDDMTSVKLSIGAFHLNRPSQEFGLGSGYRLPVRWTYAVTTSIDLTDTKFTINPAVVYHTQGTSYKELIFGSYLKFRMNTGTKVTGEKTHNALGFGLFYRNKDAMIPKLIFDLGDFSIGVAYDVNVSAYRVASKGMGGFEVSLRYNDLASSLFESRKEYR